MDARVELLEHLADPVRFAVVERLEEAPATATELASELGLSPSQLSNHLRRLREAGIVEGDRQGRHIIYALADPGLRELISLLNGLRPRPRAAARRAATALRCYDHLAGDVGVALFDALVEAGALRARDGEGRLELGPEAERVFARFDLDAPARPPRRLPAFACLDSHVGRPHLGGSLGADLLEALETRGWVDSGEQRRQLRLTEAGRRALRRRGVMLP